MAEAWVTDDDLVAAHQRLAAAIPGYRMPAAYAAARRDGDQLVFAHINRPGEVRPLPAVVLATVAGYSAASIAVRLRGDAFDRAIRLLEPAEAATHMPHPNLWSWRLIAADASPGSEFVAFFVADVSDAPVDDLDARFRRALALNDDQPFDR
jgi:hypothetical protein